MKEYLLICRSITFAQRASRAIYRAGVGNQILRTPVGLVKTGCSYAVKIWEPYLERALWAMEREHMHPVALFKFDGSEYAEVKNDLS